MLRITDPLEMGRWAASVRSEGRRIGFVPTMGFLHRGHTSLMALARPKVDLLVVSIYVNPLQFGANEDLDSYPRDLEADEEACRTASVDCVFAPADLYPPGFRTAVTVAQTTEVLCGAKRPGHFAGVTTVCARLFNLTRCDLAVFGEKDFQQLCVIRRMVRDLALPVEVAGGPLIRDEDGLALSSRNTYLSPANRERALSLHRALFAMQQAYREGEKRVQTLLGLGRTHLEVDAIDYLEIRSADDLAEMALVDRPARAFVAARVGPTRLIDNVPL